MRKGSQGTPGTTRRNDERSAALRAVRDYTAGRGGSRNQSPARSDVSSPASGSQTPVETSMSPTPPAVDEDKMRKVTKSTVEEFFGVQDYKVCVSNSDFVYGWHVPITVLFI
jgi:hypothetical protein